MKIHWKSSKIIEDHDFSKNQKMKNRKISKNQLFLKIMIVSIFFLKNRFPIFSRFLRDLWWRSRMRNAGTRPHNSGRPDFWRSDTGWLILKRQLLSCFPDIICWVMRDLSNIAFVITGTELWSSVLQCLYLTQGLISSDFGRTCQHLCTPQNVKI